MKRRTVLSLLGGAALVGSQAPRLGRIIIPGADGSEVKYADPLHLHNVRRVGLNNLGPDVVPAAEMGHHLGEYTILQLGFDPNIRTLVDGEPDKAKLYEPLILDLISGVYRRRDRVITHRDLRDGDTSPYYRRLHAYPVFRTMPEALEEIARTANSVRSRIRLQPIQITEEVLRAYAPR